MRESQKKQLKMSELRTKLNELIEKRNAVAEGQPVPEAILNEMSATTKTLGELEIEYRAAVTAEDAEDAEARAGSQDLDPELKERNELRSKIRLSRYIASAIDMRSIDGAEAEFGAAVNLPHNHLPLEILAPPVEDRAKIAGEPTVQQQRWLDRLFGATAGSALGLTYDSVGAGIPSHVVTTAGGSTAQRGRTEDASAGTFTIGITEIKPTRNAIHFEFSVEDAARIAGLEAGIERDMRAAMTEGIDATIFNGDAGANEDTADVASIFDTTGIVAKELTQANKVKAETGIVPFIELLDGLHAETLGDLNVVASVGTNQLWLQTIPLVGTTAVDKMTLGAFMRANGLTWRVREGIATGTGDKANGAMIGRARGLTGAGVVAVWEGAQLIRDPYTKAKSGEVLLTLTTLWNYAIVRPTNFAKLSFVK